MSRFTPNGGLMNDVPRFANALQAHKDRTGKTDAQIAAELKRPTSTVSRWINGRQSPTADDWFEMIFFGEVSSDLLQDVLNFQSDGRFQITRVPDTDEFDPPARDQASKLRDEVMGLQRAAFDVVDVTVGALADGRVDGREHRLIDEKALTLEGKQSRVRTLVGRLFHSSARRR